MIYFDDLDFGKGDSVIVECDNPHHGDYSANGKVGTVQRIEEDRDDDHVRVEVTVDFEDGSRRRILHYNLKPYSDEDRLIDERYRARLDAPHHFQNEVH